MSSERMDANFSTLIISFASAAVISLGLEKHPQTNKIEKDLDAARFNIDMLVVLKEKTKGNLTKEEANYFEAILTDLQLKFVQAK